MTNHDLIEQLVRASQDAVANVNRDITQGACPAKAVAAAYFAGTAQATNFLLQMDGEVTPQQLQMALIMLAERYGFRAFYPDTEEAAPAVLPDGEPKTLEELEGQDVDVLWVTELVSRGVLTRKGQMWDVSGWSFDAFEVDSIETDIHGRREVVLKQ